MASPARFNPRRAQGTRPRAWKRRDSTNLLTARRKKLPLEYWDSLIGDFRDEIAGQQRLLADIIAIRSKFYPDAPRETHEVAALPALLSDLRDFVQGLRDDILESDPSAERIHAVQKIDSLVWRTTKALEAR
jgi:hypothetical protein